MKGDGRMLNTLKNLRLRAGLTQEEAARRINVKQNQISSWEHGRFLPMARRIPAIAKTYRCTAEDVIDAMNETIIARNK